MALALDATTSASGGSSWSHTCSGSNRILLVGCYANTDTVTGVTYNSVAMTLIGKTSFPGAGRQGAYLYYLIAPATGSNTVAVTGGTGIGAVSYTGALQSGQPDSSAVSNPANATSITLSTTVVKDNSWLVCVTADGAGSETAGAGTTIRQTDANGLVLADSNGEVDAGSRSLIINWSGSQPNAGVIASIATSSTEYTMNADVGAFTLTGVSAPLSYGKVLAAEVGNYVLTGVSATLTWFRKWTNQDKNSSVMTNESKNSSSWSNESKNSSTFTNEEKN